MIVQDTQQLEYLYKRISSEISYVLPIFTNFKHHVLNNHLSSVHIMFEDGKYYCVPINHIDTSPIDFSLSDVFYTVTPDKKSFMHEFSNISDDNVYDFKAYQYLKNIPIINLETHYPHYMSSVVNYAKFGEIANVLPISVLVDYAINVLNHIRENFSTELPPGYKFFNKITIPTLKGVEESGLFVDEDKFIENFGAGQKTHIKNSLVYTEYNPYTATGRPSNKFGGVNYAALGKSGGDRVPFISRYGKDGVLIQYDYEAFHPRLIASKVFYDIPPTSFHEYMAKIYYNTDVIDESQYEESKKKTFHLLYGVGTNPRNNDFFRLVGNYADFHFSEYNKNGYYESDSGRHLVVDEVTKNRLFNYIVQLLETETFLSRLYKVNQLLNGCLTKPILYTYDAILVDAHKSEGDILGKIKNLLEGNNKKYPLRVYSGNSYSSLQKIFS
jgi:hypothetical protein